jgi:hypothetical protein
MQHMKTSNAGTMLGFILGVVVGLEGSLWAWRFTSCFSSTLVNKASNRTVEQRTSRRDWLWQGWDPNARCK